MSSDDYLKDIGRIPLLTPEQEIVLGNKVQEMMKLLEKRGITQQISASNLAKISESLSDDEIKIVKTGIKARNKIVSSNMRLVVTIARKYINRQNKMTMQDLIQEGAVGLTRAAEKFDPSRGYKFSTYAYLWIKQGMTRGYESQSGIVKLPAHMQRTIRKAMEVRLRLVAKLSREPSFEEIAKEIGDIDVDKLREMVSMNPVVVSLDFSSDMNSGSLREGRAYMLIDLLNTDDESSIKDKEIHLAKLDFVMMAINALDKSEKELIYQRYGIGIDAMSIKQISENTGIAPQLIRERQQKIMKKIRYIVTRFTAPNS